MPPWRDMMSIALEHSIRPPRPGLDHANLDYLEVWTSCNAVDRRSQHTLGVNLSSVSRQCQQQSQTLSTTIADREGTLPSTPRSGCHFCSRPQHFHAHFRIRLAAQNIIASMEGTSQSAVSVLWVSWAVSACWNGPPVWLRHAETLLSPTQYQQYVQIRP